MVTMTRRRDQDNVENTLQATHEIIGRFRTLLDDLSSHVTELEAELAPHQKGSE